MRYIIWNAHKLSNAAPIGGLRHDTDTYDALQQVEALTGCSYASIIDTTDIEAVRVAMVNECDVDIAWVAESHAHYKAIKAARLLLNELEQVYGNDKLVDIIGRSWGGIMDELGEVEEFLLAYKGDSDE